MTKQQKAEVEIALRRIKDTVGMGLSIERWSPGDGWARYRVHSDDVRGSCGWPESPYMPYRELRAFLAGMLAAVEWKARIEKARA